MVLTRKHTEIFGYANVCLLWGFYLCLSIVMVWNVRVHRTDSFRSPIMIALGTLFFLNGYKLVVDIVTLYFGYVLGKALPGDKEMRILSMLGDTGIFGSMMLADLIIVWRLWVVWRRDWRIMVIPTILLLGQFGTEMAIFVLDTVKIWMGQGELRQMRYRGAVRTCVITSLSLNIICTGMICGRLWWADRQMAKSYASGDRTPPKASYARIIRALIESGSIYLLYLTMYIMGIYLGNGMVQYVFTRGLSVAAGIVPTLIQLQRSLGYLQPNEISRGSAGQTTTSGPGIKSTNVRFGNLHMRSMAPTELSYQSTRVTIHEEKVVREDSTLSDKGDILV